MNLPVPQYSIPDVGSVIGGKYAVENVIGQGGMGIVYAAVNRATGKRVAIKMLLPHVAANADFARRFQREAQASGRIAHRNVVDVYDAGEDAHSPFLVMEFLNGMTLAEYLTEHGKLSLPLALAILEPVGRGVEAAHAKGIIHRDLKPDNVFLRVDENGAPLEPKVLDFGISKMDDASLGPATVTGHAMGTPYYMSPEQMVAAKAVTAASDVYALGVILFHMLTRQLPYKAENLPDLVLQVHTKDPRPLVDLLPDASPTLSTVLLRAMHREPSERYGSVAEFFAALEPFGLGGNGAALPSFVAPDRMREIRRVDARLAVSPSGHHIVSKSGEVPIASQSAAFGPTLPSTGRGSSLMPRDSTARPAVDAGGPRVSPKLAAVLIVAGGTALVVGLAFMMRPASKSPGAAAASTASLPEPPTVAAVAPTGRAHLLAPAHAGAEVFVDGLATGRLGPTGEAVLTVSADRHFFELRRDGTPVASTMADVTSGAMIDVPLASAPVAQVQAAAPTERASRAVHSAPGVSPAEVAPAAEVPAPSGPPPPTPGCRQRGPNGVCLDDL